MPRVTETFRADDYQQAVSSQSRIDPTKTLWDFNGYRCPSCTELLFLLHGLTYHCRCGAVLLREGNALTVTADVPEEQEEPDTPIESEHPYR